MKKSIKTGLHVFYIAILVLGFVASMYSKLEFANETVEEYYFYFTNNITSSDNSMTIYAIQHYWSLFIVIFIIIIALFYNIVNRTFKTKKGFQIYPIDIIRKNKVISTIILSVILISISLGNVKAYRYIKNNIYTTDIYEEKYVQGSSENITFNKTKKNLIYIYIESLETTFFDKNNGGDWESNVIPELYDLLNDEDAIYFSRDDKSKGFRNLYGTSWTTASIISNSTGMPFKIPISINEFSNTNFLNDFYSLGDALKDNGYHNEVISGAPTEFGGLTEFFNKHGEYTIIDAYNLEKYGFKIDNETRGAWGFNDKYMFEMAKERITKFYREGILFNETLIGIDTHPMDGYKTPYMIDKYETQYENVYATESMIVKEFIDWLKEQEFYKDTVVVIVGDHYCMQSNFIDSHNMENRGRYNVILNSSVKTDNTKNREFTSLDFYPTTLAAMGATIKNDQIGLGVNLFSEKKTLSEELEYDKFNIELAKKSKFYNDVLRGE